MSDPDDPADNPADDTASIPINPLENLLERVKLDVTMAYKENVIAALVGLRQSEPGEYVKLYHQLRKANPEFRAKEFNKAIDAQEAKSSLLIGAPADTATLLVGLSNQATYFTDPEGEAVFAEFLVEERPITALVQSKQYLRWLRGAFYDKCQQAPSRDAVKNAIDTIEARAFKAGVACDVFIRIGRQDGKIYIDRGTKAGDVIEVDADGYRVLPTSPVKFIRPRGGLGELPIPMDGGKIEELRDYVHLRDKRDFQVLVAFLLGCFQGDGELLHLLILGPHGSAKTTTMRRISSLIDPMPGSGDPLAPLREDRDLLPVAQGRHLLAFDNVKSLSTERSAHLCRIASGGSVSGRELFTTAETFFLSAKKPVVQTATEQIVTEEDLQDRTPVIHSGAAFEDENSGQRKSRRTLDAAFEKARPRLLGVLLRAVAEGLKRENDPEPPTPHRMADHVAWVTRCEPGLGWAQGTILAALNEATREGARELAELHPVSAALLSFMAGHPDEWEGTTTELLSCLRATAGERIARGQGWPASPAVLSRRLHQLEVVLRRARLRLIWGQHHTSRKLTVQWSKPAYGNGEDRTETENEAPGKSVDTEAEIQPTVDAKGVKL
jgi:hypothetical protein